MKKILLIMLATFMSVTYVNADTEKVYLIKDGVEQTEFTGGSVFEKLEGSDGDMGIQEGYIDFYVDIWGHWILTFNNTFDFSKYQNLKIDFAFPETNNTDFSQYIFSQFTLTKSGFKQQFLSASTTERTIYSYSIPEDVGEDILRLGFANLANGDYMNYPLSVYNLWFETEIEKETIVADTTLDTFYTLYLDKIKSLVSYSLENKYLLCAIGIIFLFAILELILNLFNKGGYRK